MNKQIGEKLKELRKERNKPLEDILLKLKMSESTYGRMERGETATWTSKIDAICELYQITPEELILAKETYLLISKKQKGNTASNITINNASEKAFELYERMLEDLKTEIQDLKENMK